LRHCSNVKGNGLGRSRLDRTAVVICTNHNIIARLNTIIQPLDVSICLIFLLSRDLFAFNGFGTVPG
jgi:hypothetical protein